MVAGAILMGWLMGLSAPALPTREPGADKPPGTAAKPAIDLKGAFTAGPGKAADLPGSWPCFRGPDRDGIAREAPRLPDAFPANGPAKKWSMKVGYGFAAPVVDAGRVYLIDYDTTAKQDAIRCLSLADGAEIWRRTYPVMCKNNHGMSRTVPALADGVLVTMGPRCHVVACDAASGDFRWGLDLVKDFGTKEPPWYAGQCPLIDQGKVILAPAGPEVLLMAIDLKTGKPLWKTPNPHAWVMTHSSVMIATIHEVRQYVYCGSGGMAGIAVDDGRLLWTTADWKVNIATIATPVQVAPDRLFCAGGYASGAAMLTFTKGADGTFAMAVAWRTKATVFGSDQQTPVFYQDHLYGVAPDGQFVCLGLDGKRIWASGPANRFGLGPYLIADGRILVLSDHGLLTMATATTEGWKPQAKAQVLDGHDAWGPLALAGTRLLVRDFDTLACLDLAGAVP